MPPKKSRVSAQVSTGEMEKKSDDWKNDNIEQLDCQDSSDSEDDVAPKNVNKKSVLDFDFEEFRKMRKEMPELDKIKLLKLLYVEASDNSDIVTKEFARETLLVLSEEKKYFPLNRKFKPRKFFPNDSSSRQQNHQHDEPNNFSGYQQHQQPPFHRGQPPMTRGTYRGRGRGF